MPDVNKEFMFQRVYAYSVHMPAYLGFWSSWCAERIALRSLWQLFSGSA